MKVFIFRVIVGNEGGDVFIDATLLQELVQSILNTTIKLGSRAEKVSSYKGSCEKQRKKCRRTNVQTTALPVSFGSEFLA